MTSTNDYGGTEMTPAELIGEAERVLAQAMTPVNAYGELTEEEVQKITMHATLVTAHAQLALAKLAAEANAPILLKWAGPTTKADIQCCGHGGIAWRNGDHWVHPGSMVRCDRPPMASDDA